MDRIKAVFLAALDRAGPSERAAFLTEACAEDAALRQRVEALLRAHDQADPLLDRPAAELLDREATHVAVAEGGQVGTVVADRYKLLEQIGEGGMGAVWVAEQTQPVRRKVAVKLIKAGMDSKQVLARFEAERQALALMDHPNIAKVLDGGTTASGRPFFVMEYVKGVPLTTYCDDARLSVAERLALFVPVCRAVQHAHQKGIIHRDLKPANILVCPYDGKPVPKVIDFGLAKAMQQPLTEHTVYTAHGLLMGTPLYMSPEQAEINNLDVDTRTDIYALGVILYELLTGTTPLENRRLKKASWPEMLRLIKEEPPLPSARLSSSATLPSVAALRQLEPVKLTKLVRGDLDWIVMKALEKDRNRRYETANSFAQDVQRHLAGEPVLAAPPGARYRLRKFVRKHRAAFLTAAAILLLLLAGVAVSTWQAVRATDAEATARLAEQDARQAQQAEAARAEGEARAKQKAVDAAEAAKRAHAQAQRRLAQVEKGNEVLVSIFADLDIRKVKEGTEPLEAVLAGRLVKAARQLEGEAVGDLLMVAGLQERLGLTLMNLGHPREAIPLFVKARRTRQAKQGPDHPDTLRSMNNLATGYQAAGQLDLALPLYEETLKLRKARLGADHLDTLASMSNLAAGYQAAGKLDLALPLLEEAFRVAKARLGADHPDTLTNMNNLAMGYRDAGKLERALPLLEEALKLRKVKLGSDHRDTLVSMGNLASGYAAAGRLEVALPLYEETHQLTRAILGADHPDTLTSMNNLARGYQIAGKLDLALPLYEQTLKLRKARLGADHPDTLASMHNLAGGYQAAGKLDLALPLLEESVELRKAKLGADHP
jgi:tetratricopeptide (TPR) repeat protein